jgi:transcription initiation factor TFIID TATA-box-binding protein
VAQLVSAVGGGKLARELDLDQLATDLDAEEVQHEPSKYHGIIARFAEDDPAILIYRSGSFSISGAKSIEQLKDTFRRFEAEMGRLLGDIKYETPFEVRNLVHRTQIPIEETGGSLNLNALAIGLQVENVEYEPEQFPGLMYRPPDIPGLFLIFASGALVSTGHSDPDTAASGLELVSERAVDLLQLA